MSTHEVLNVKMRRRKQELGEDFVIEEAGPTEQPSHSQSGSAKVGNNAPRARKTAKIKGIRGRKG